MLATGGRKRIEDRSYISQYMMLKISKTKRTVMAMATGLLSILKKLIGSS
jgi:hypothetical protein